MKKLIGLMLLILPATGYCDTKISALTSTPTVSASDIIPIVGNTGGTPVNRVVTYNNFTNSMSSVTISNTSGLPLRLNQPTIGATSEGISFSNAGAQQGYLIQDNYSGFCSDLATTCLSSPVEIGGTSASHYYFNNDGRFWTSQGTLVQNAYSSVIGGSLIIGGSTGDANYTDIQQIGDGNLFVNHGFIASSGTINGSGDGQIQLTIGATTYMVASSSTPASNTAGHLAIWSGAGNATLIDGGALSGIAGSPGGSSGQIQYNNGGAFGGATGSVVTASSISLNTQVVLRGTTSVLLGGAQASANTGNNGLNVWAQTVPIGYNLMNVGSSTQGDQWRVPNGEPVSMTFFGATIGALDIGLAGQTYRIGGHGDLNAYLDLRDNLTSSVTLRSGTAFGQGDIRILPANVFIATFSAVSGVTLGVQSSTTNIVGNLSTNGGLYISSKTSNGSGGVVNANYTTGTTDSVIFASSTAGGITITLRAASSVPTQVLQFTKVDSTTQTVRVFTPDLINGTTHQIVLYTIGQTAEIISDGIGWWPHGQGIPVTPSSIFPISGGQTTVIGVSSSVYSCVVNVPLPVSVMGFRYSGIAMALPGQVAFGLFDSAGNVLKSTGPVYGSATVNTVSLGQDFINIPAGQYYVGFQGSNTAISANGSGGIGSTPFCEVTASTSMGMPSTITVVGGSSTARNFRIDLVLSGGRAGE